jgi:hypothetical protein
MIYDRESFTWISWTSNVGRYTVATEVIHRISHLIKDSQNLVDIKRIATSSNIDTIKSSVVDWANVKWEINFIRKNYP